MGRCVECARLSCSGRSCPSYRLACRRTGARWSSAAEWEKSGEPGENDPSAPASSPHAGVRHGGARRDQSLLSSGVRGVRLPFLPHRRGGSLRAVGQGRWQQVPALPYATLGGAWRSRPRMSCEDGCASCAGSSGIQASYGELCRASSIAGEMGENSWTRNNDVEDRETPPPGIPDCLTITPQTPAHATEL